MLLRVLCLEHTDLATDEDRQFGLLMWARYFTAATWEELIALAEDYPVMEKPVSKAWQLSEEQRIRELMMLREEGIRVRRTEEELYRRTNEKYQQAIAERAEAFAKLDQAQTEIQRITAKNQQITEDNQRITKENQRLAQMLCDLGVDPEKQ